MSKKQFTGWRAIALGTVLALAADLALLMLAALLLVRGVLPETAEKGLTAGSLGLAALTGGLIAAERGPFGPVGNGVLCGCLADAAVVLLGLLLWRQPDLAGMGAMLLPAGAAGGLAAGLIRKRSRVRRKAKLLNRVSGGKRRRRG